MVLLKQSATNIFFPVWRLQVSQESISYCSSFQRQLLSFLKTKKKWSQKYIFFESNIQAGSSLAALESIKKKKINEEHLCLIRKLTGDRIHSYSVDWNVGENLNWSNQQYFYICLNCLLVLGTKLKFSKVK